MALLDVVDDSDQVIGMADFLKIHKEGLRHRSIQVLVTDKPITDTNHKLLVARRSKKQETSAYKFHPPVGGHVRIGQGYIWAAYEQLQDELFHDNEIPNEIELIEIARYRNDTRETNKENTVLYQAIYAGPFNPNLDETSELIWQSRSEINIGLSKNPDDYTTTFKNALQHI